MKIILPIGVVTDIEPHLPPGARFVRVDSDGNFDDDASDALRLSKLVLPEERCPRQGAGGGTSTEVAAHAQLGV